MTRPPSTTTTHTVQWYAVDGDGNWYPCLNETAARARAPKQVSAQVVRQSITTSTTIHTFDNDPAVTS